MPELNRPRRNLPHGPLFLLAASVAIATFTSASPAVAQEAPATPEAPAAPEAPATPEAPAAPEAPATPEAPSAEVPAIPEVPAAETPESIPVQAPTPLPAATAGADSTTATTKKKIGIGLGVSSGLDVGLGSFVKNEFARNEMVSWNLGVTPRYKPDAKTTISAGLSVSQEVTPSEGDSHRYQLLLSDTTLGVSRDIYTIPKAEIGIKGRFTLYFPSSLASRQATLMTAGRIGLTLDRTFGPVTIALNSAFRKNFHRYTTPATDISENPTLELARAGGEERLTDRLVSTGGNNTSYSTTNGISLAIAPVKKFNIAIGYALTNGWTYESFAKDELSSPNADAGRGQRDTQNGSLEFSYQVHEMVGLALGTSTSSSPKFENNKGWRFPWFDFSSESENLTTFYFNLNFSHTLL